MNCCRYLWLQLTPVTCWLDDEGDFRNHFDHLKRSKPSSVKLANCSFFTPRAVIPYQFSLLQFCSPQVAFIELGRPLDYFVLFLPYKVKGFLQVISHSNPIYRSQWFSLWWSWKDNIHWQICFPSMHQIERSELGGVVH